MDFQENQEREDNVVFPAPQVTQDPKEREATPVSVECPERTDPQAQ